MDEVKPSSIGERKTARAANKGLEQFFTPLEVASSCLDSMISYLGPGYRELHWLEPSAGAGVFVDQLLKRGVPEANIFAYDLEPRHPLVKQANLFDVVEELPERMVTIGNPPYGHRNKLSIAFLNAVIKKSSLVGFVVPGFWRHPSLHAQLDPHAHWVFDQAAGNKFILPDGSTKSVVNATFQLWEWRDELRISDEDSTDRGYFTSGKGRDGDLFFNPLGRRSPWSREHLGINCTPITFAHPLVELAALEINDALVREKNNWYSSISVFSKKRIRIHLNRWMDEHPAEKAVVEAALRVNSRRDLFSPLESEIAQDSVSPAHSNERLWALADLR